MSCCVKYCKNIRRLMDPDSNVTFHRIPKPYYLGYMAHLGLESKSYTRKFICSEHFLKEDFTVKKHKYYLKKGVLPTQKLRQGTNTVGFDSEMGESASTSCKAAYNLLQPPLVKCIERTTLYSDNVGQTLQSHENHNITLREVNYFCMPFNCEKDALREYNCSYCDFKSHLLVMLYCHTKNSHLSLTNQAAADFQVHSYICKRCYVTTSSVLYWFKHHIRCSSDLLPRVRKPLRKHDCTYCLFKTTNQRDLEKHVIRKHTAPEDIKWFECTQCDYKAKIEFSLKTHVRLKHVPDHETVLFYCDLCEYKTKNKRNVKRHTLIHHTATEEALKYSCSQCAFKTKHRGDLKRHVITLHTAPEELILYECDQCSYKGKLKSYLNRHMRLHHASDDKVNSKSLYCNVSLYRRKKGNIKKATATIPTITETVTEDLYKYKCKHCAFKTKHRGDLPRHVVTLHSAPENIKLYACDQCSYKGKLRSYLNRHMRLHHTSGEKTNVNLISCNASPYRSQKDTNIKEDTVTKLTAESVIKYECTYCPFKARQQSELERHLICKHTAPEEIRWYRCDQCEYKGKLKSFLITHVKFKHGTDVDRCKVVEEPHC